MLHALVIAAFLLAHLGTVVDPLVTASAPRVITMTLAGHALLAVATLALALLATAHPKLASPAWSFARFAPGLALAWHAVACTALGWVPAISTHLAEIPAAATFAAVLPLILVCLAAFAAEALFDLAPFGQPPTQTAPRRAALTGLMTRLTRVLSGAWSRARVRLLFVLVPIAAIQLTSDLAAYLWPQSGPLSGPIASPTLLTLTQLALALAVFVLMPPVLRRIWRTRPLPPGPARDAALAVLADHRVRVRNVLLWDTRHTIANAAVLGALAPLRYVIVSDLLLARLSPAELAAVLAHEAAHIRRRHIPWLVTAMLGTILLAGTPVALTAELATIPLTFLLGPGPSSTLALVASTLGTLVCAVLFAGWVSRVFERQADAAGVLFTAHAATDSDSEPATDPAATPATPTIITPEAVLVMESALIRVAALVSLPVRRRTLRHGSIAQRVRAIRSLSGHPIAAQTPQDRAARRAKLTAALVLILGLAAAGTEHLVRAALFDTPRAHAASSPAGG